MVRWKGPASGISTKSSPTDLVSDADREAEAAIIEVIAASRPDDAVLSEERAQEDAGHSGLRWIIDPLDGTINYLYGIHEWCVSIAVEDASGTVVGVVHAPTRRETFTALRGRGAHMNGDPVHVSGREDLAKALIGTGFAYDARTRAAQAEVVKRILPRVRDIRRPGSAALDLASLASGRIDGFYEAHMELWDKAAGVLLVTEAGGVVSELSDPFGDSHGVVAAGPKLHDALRAIVAS